SVEKHMFISFMYHTFKEDIISIKTFYWSGFQEAFTLRYFYNLEEKQFFYTKDLFNQLYLYGLKLLDPAQQPLQEKQSKNLSKLLYYNDGANILNLVKLTENRIENQKIDFGVNKIKGLMEFHQYLKLNITNLNIYKKLKLANFFIDNINLIEFIPSFQKFGLSNTFLYFYPSCIDEIDFKLLLGNTFNSIKFVIQIDVSTSFLIEYTYPYQNQGYSSYLNWLTKTKKVIREFCSFNIKKVYQILHFNYNISSDGWDIDPNRFKVYFQNILFNPDYKVEIQGLKEYKIGDMENYEFLGPESNEYKNLIQIYNKKAINIKSVWATATNLKKAVNIRDLMEKDLIFPYIKLKNMKLIEEINIIIPNVSKKFNEKILQIFSFFNVAFIHKIEGSYYIHGFDDVIKFENGFFIKLSIPDCQIDELERLFELIFEYMGIDHYVIINDLVEGKPLLESIYGNLDFLKRYNPLTNLIWNNKDKRWMNHQLFTKKFQPLYPDLFYGQSFVCKRCGISLDKGRICIDCLYEIAKSEENIKQEVRKILNFELSDVYSEVLNSVKKDILMNLDVDVVKINIEERLNEFLNKLNIFVKRIFNPFSFYEE
ncbi:MAG: hypothetical protein ACFFKA_01440, partial [Candidatus Thorarchaeota archaeon]